MAKNIIVMPKLGESLTSGTITNWMKQVGDQVELDDILFSISTEKVESEIPSPYQGYLTAIHFPVGSTVDVGVAVAEISPSLASTLLPANTPTSSHTMQPDLPWDFDVVVVGGGPGGYIAAIRASQLGQKVALIEHDRLGGVCLNRGCIPTKAVLKSAHAVHELKEMAELGIDVEVKNLSGKKAVQRAGKVAARISKGVEFLLKKNKITVIAGTAKLAGPHEILYNVSGAGSDGSESKKLQAKTIILATGAHYRTFPGLQHDGKRIIGAWEAVKLENLPKSIGIIGAGAIGVEFAYFWNAFGVDVHIFEAQTRLLPVEDDEVSEEVAKAYKKYGIKLSLGLEQVSVKSDGSQVTVSTIAKGAKEDYSFEMALIAVGMVGNTENIGLAEAGVQTERGFIKVNEFYQTSVPSIYAIGDVAGPPLLAHAASHEGIIAAEHLSGLHPHPLNKLNIPGCTYCVPQVASVGYTERELKAQNISYRVGKLPFVANGKAVASNEKEGFVKVLMGEYGELLGAHIVGNLATELIHEYVLLRSMEGIDQDLWSAVHPHPTLGEFLSEAVLAAAGRSLNY